MNDALSRYIEAATGITKTTRARAEEIVKRLLHQGEAAARDPKELVDQLIERSQENREALTALIRSESRRAVRAMGLATREDLERLERQISEAKRTAAAAQESAGQSSAGTQKTPSAAKKASARPAAKKAAKKTAATKTTEGTGESAGEGAGEGAGE
ncbi:MAG: hypothetical protein KY462_09365 [Actinobacteria bacterium]|nr:hypothetical protein [Actinomycetota bacterium]